MTTFDAIVVGSGAAGSFATKELTERGLDVLLLEAGRAIEPEVDFPVPARRDRGYLDRALYALKGQPIQVRCPRLTAATRQFFVNDRENPYTTPSDKPFNWFRGRQLGGRLHVWGRLALRYSDAELSTWPIGYDDLRPYYDRAERTWGLLGSRDGLASLPDGEYAGPWVPTALECRFKERVEAKLKNLHVINARVIKHNPKRVPLPLLAAQRTGRLTVKTDAVVARVTVDHATGKASGVLFVDRLSRKSQEVRARVVVLCASTIETLRIMINSACAQHPGGIGNSSGRLGRFLTDHRMVHLRGPVDPSQCELGADGCSDPYDFGRANGFYIPRFDGVGGGRRDGDPFRGIAVQGAIGREKAGWYLLAFAELAPVGANRVTLDESRHDAWGIPAARIEYSPSPEETTLIESQKAALEEIAYAAGLEVARVGSRGIHERLLRGLMKGRVLDERGAFLPGASIHEAGGAAMGTDPRTSVLNRFNQCWDVPNLFVTDGSCFASAGNQNPTLTIMALTARACDYIATEMKAGAF